MQLLKDRHLPAAFSALKHRNYRLLWMGNLISQSGDWMDNVAFSWLVYDMTHSSIALAMVNVCRAVPILFFTLVAGVVADRVERRKILFSTQAILMVVAFILSFLLVTGTIQVWMVFVIATTRGIVNSFNQPARQSLISDLVPKEDLANAVGLNAATANLTRVFGPAIGGILIATVGVTGAFLLNSLSFVAVLIGLFMMTFPPRMARPQTSAWKDLTAGFRYLKGEKAMRTLVFLALVPLILGQPYQTMLTVFARDVFHAGGSGLGLMQSTVAVGALTGALLVASSRQSRHFHIQMILGLFGFGGFLLLFVLCPNIWIALPVLLMIGISNQTYQTSNNTLLQMNVDPEYRGRVLSTLFLQRGLVPLGTVMAGVGTDLVGARYAIGGMALGLLIVGALAVPMAFGALRQLRTAFDEKTEEPAGAEHPEEMAVAGS